MVLRKEQVSQFAAEMLKI